MNIEVKIIDYLRSKMENDRVYPEVPDSPSGEFFVVDKTGSTKENQMMTSTIAIQSYARSKHRASELNEEVKSAMEELVQETGIGACHLLSDYNFTNTATKYRRYQAVFLVTHY